MVIKDKIEERGIKRKWLAKKLNISETALSFFLNGQRPMPERVELELKKLLQ